MRDWPKTAWLVGGLAALLGLATVALLDRPLAHGFTVHWYHPDPSGARVLVDTTTEHRVAFPNAHRPLARYINGWPHEVMPILATLPQVDAVLRARLEVPPGPPRSLVADVDESAEIYADGARLGPTDTLAPGPHDLWIRWRARPRPHPRMGRAADSARFVLLWDASHPVPASALRPADGAWTGLRIALWAVGGPLALLFAWLMGRAWGAGTPAARRRRWGAVATLLIVLLAFGLRSFDYDVMPEFRENGDELFAIWNGWSLLEDGTPRGWSLWAGSYGGALQVETVHAWSQRWNVVTPYFEHPPLTHLLIGAAAHLGGAEGYLDATLADTRVVPIALTTFSTLLVIALGRRYCPEGPAPYLGGLLFAAVPAIAMQSRVIKEESLLVPLVLAMVLFFLRWRESRRTRDLVGAALCAGLSTLAKIPAVVWVPALTMLVAAEQGERRRAYLVAAIGLGVSALVLVYAASIDLEVFFLTQGKQGGRPTHWNLFSRFLDHIRINHNHVGRGWILFLWVGYLTSVAQRGFRNSAPIVVPMITWMVAIGLGSGNWSYGWYWLPMYPFLCVGAGDFLGRLWQKPDLLKGTLFIVLLVMYTLSFTMDLSVEILAVNYPAMRRVVTVFLAAFLVPYGLVQVWPRRRDVVALARLSTAAGLAVFVGASVYFVVHYETIYETHHDFDLDLYWTP